jgi:hypothetical protein
MTREEIDRKYMEELERIQNAPSIGEGDAMIRSMSMNELRRWYEREVPDV